MPCGLGPTTTASERPEPNPAWHLTIEFVVHDVVKQSVDESVAAGVTSPFPKFKPIKLIVAMPEFGTLASERAVRTGESNDKKLDLVPTIPEIVIVWTFAAATAFCMYPTGVEHAMLVGDDQLAVKHMLAPIVTLAVASTL